MPEWMNMIIHFQALKFGKHIKPAMEKMVHGVGAKVTSFPPINTINVSSVSMLSRGNLSCGSNCNTRWLSVVASTKKG